MIIVTIDDRAHAECSRMCTLSWRPWFLQFVWKVRSQGLDLLTEFCVCYAPPIGVRISGEPPSVQGRMDNRFCSRVHLCGSHRKRPPFCWERAEEGQEWWRKQAAGWHCRTYALRVCHFPPSSSTRVDILLLILTGTNCTQYHDAYARTGYGGGGSPLPESSTPHEMTRCTPRFVEEANSLPVRRHCHLLHQRVRFDFVP